MYIHPILVGVIGTLLFEVAACVIFAIWNDSKKK